MRKKPFRLLSAPLLALAMVLSVMSSPARADSDPLVAVQWELARTTYNLIEALNHPNPALGRAARSQSISVDIAAPRDEVFGIYSNFENHIGANPLLQRVVVHADTTSGGVRTINQTAIENTPLQPGLPATPINTHAQQRINAAGYFYEVDSWTLPNVITHQTITFEDLGAAGTRVTENLTFEASILLIDYTVSQGVMAHQGIQSVFKDRIENGFYS
ncbi:SRPBCC family protein [Herbidospora daliensis]|uniref:SRPBCC family protein n=1 Tax=Herbidospora daliensis TaxID=295585 RepID=UPI000783A0C6|nr:SRPBCC family protein [Herbidospora daliensis]